MALVVRGPELQTQDSVYFIYNHSKNSNGSPSDYLHSSALFYRTAKHSIYEVTNYKELEDKN